MVFKHEWSKEYSVRVNKIFEGVYNDAQKSYEADAKLFDDRSMARTTGYCTIAGQLRAYLKILDEENMLLEHKIDQLEREVYELRTK